MDLTLNPNGGTAPEFLKKKKPVKPGDENKNGMNDGKEQKNGGKGKGKGKDGGKGMKPVNEIGDLMTEAHADFSQSNVNGIQAKNVEGVRLPDGNFIFVWRDD